MFIILAKFVPTAKRKFKKNNNDLSFLPQQRSSKEAEEKTFDLKENSKSNLKKKKVFWGVFFQVLIAFL